MTLSNLENLVKIKQLKKEPPDQKEFEGLIQSAKHRLQDAKVVSISDESRFLLAYGAAHGFALSALRWHGYRSDNRYLVFQCLKHTLELSDSKWRVLDLCHRQRNIAEYEGHLEFNQQLFNDLINITEELEGLAKMLVHIKRT